MCILSTRKFGPSEAAAFSTALSGNTSLTELLASGHPLEVAGASAFGQALSRNTTLRSLCVGDNHFGDEGVIALVEGLKRNHGLLVLDLEYKSIASGEGLRTLLETHPTLAVRTYRIKGVDLRLGRNQLGEAGIKSLSAGLSLSSTLLRLDLSGNQLNAAAAEALGRALCTHRPAGTSAVGGVDGGGSGGGGGVSPPPPPLEFLDVSRNPLGDKGGAALFRALATSPTLTGLVLAEAKLGPLAAAALAEALVPPPASPLPGGGGPSGPAEPDSGEMTPLPPPPPPPANGGGLQKLQTLDVSKNELGAGGGTEVAGALSRGGAPRLETLSMAYNDVGDDGAAALGKAAGPRLAVLDLSGNALGGAGIGAVLSAPGLREAKLFHNACKDEGVPLVLEALLAGGTLQTLDLGANGLTGAGLEILLPGLAACSSLQTLEVGANSNDERAEEAVRRSQSSNPALDIAFRRGGEAMEGSGAPPGVGIGGGTAGGPGAAASWQTQ
ncbi:unnamed protein product [Ectocarpus sp. CCAP 1310/34]|nr:unnamed protein product [Ectocarpus sp. CCAP 1310/34]